MFGVSWMMMRMILLMKNRIFFPPKFGVAAIPLGFAT